MEASDRRRRPVGRLRQPLNACATCRARKVKCDERENGCLNCERLQLTCPQLGPDIESPSTITGPKRKRTYRSCISCRNSKVRCSGDKPKCSRCSRKGVTCVYDSETEPAWIQSLALSASEPLMSNADHQSIPPLPPNKVTAPVTVQDQSLVTWLSAQELPPRPRLERLLDAYFANVHPIRVFGFIHKPSFMQRLDNDSFTEPADQALLHIVCALGARFHALESHQSTSMLSQETIQHAGSQWAKIAEKLLFADYGSISVVRLEALVLLHDYEARMGNYAQSFLHSGLITRMAHALQINLEASKDILGREALCFSDEVLERESRRRLMWACYMVDMWAGSGVDQLTLVNVQDIKIQLPCNDTHFVYQTPCVTETLGRGQILNFIPPESLTNKPSENMGISAYYIRIIHIWQRVLRFVKHLDEVQPPWLPRSEFAMLHEDIKHWRADLPSWLDFTPTNIYIRREASQLGAMFLVHCLYHHAICDLNRISLLELFKVRERFEFPVEQIPFMKALQLECFEESQRVAQLISTVLRHGVRFLADPILPSFAYNSSRIMLYYIARILDLTRPESGVVIGQVLNLVESNVKALRDMSLMYPLAEPLYITTERWLDKVRNSIGRPDTTAYIGPEDPSEVNEINQDINNSSPSSVIEPDPDHQLNPLSVFRLTRKTIQSPHPDNSSPTISNFSESNTARPNHQVFPQPNIEQALPSEIIDPRVETLQPPPRFGGNTNMSTTNFESFSMFDLNDLQNFFEWDIDTMPNTTGNEDMSAFGFMNQYGTM